MKKTAFLIFISLLILASLFVYKERQPKNIPQKNELIQKIEEKSSSSAATALTSELTGIVHPSFSEIDAVAIDKSNWQIYENKQYGFKISAPKTWSIILSADDGSLENGGQLMIRPTNDNDPLNSPVALQVQIDNSSARDWLLKAVEQAATDHEKFIEISIPTSDGAFAETSVMGLYGYNIKKGDKVFGFGAMDVLSDIKNQDAMMKAIVETLRFTK
ncbi:MAG: hypothetical protein PHO56_03785 [Patescibacteria group bacterium]|nr:hypothetical protein [Patescibacteria group bacterium]